MQRRATQKKGKRVCKKKKVAPVEKKPQSPPQPVQSPVTVVRPTRLRKTRVVRRNLSFSLGIAIFSISAVFYFIVFLVCNCSSASCVYIPDPDSPLASQIDRTITAIIHFLRAKSFKLGPMLVSCAMFAFLLETCKDPDAAGGYSLLLWLDQTFSAPFAAYPSLSLYTTIEIGAIACLYRILRTPSFTIRWKVMVAVASCASTVALIFNINGILTVVMLVIVMFLTLVISPRICGRQLAPLQVGVWLCLTGVIVIVVTILATTICGLPVCRMYWKPDEILEQMIAMGLGIPRGLVNIASVGMFFTANLRRTHYILGGLLIGAAVLALLLPMGSGGHITLFKVSDCKTFLRMVSGIILCRQRTPLIPYLMFLVGMFISWVIVLASENTEVEASINL